MSTLTERYVQEVVRRIPGDQRDEVAGELRATIADTLEARGAPEAERDVLIEMGDPIRLAAGYADRPLTLIGPELYPAYTRLMAVLLSTVLPLTVAAAVVLDVLDHNDAGSAIGAGIGALFAVGAQLVVWPTAVFALIERSRLRRGSALTAPWTPDDLPEPGRSPARRTARAYASAVWDMLLLALIVWQHAAKPYGTDGGERAEVLLWSGWMWPVVAGLAGMALAELVRIAVGGWNLRLATGYAAAGAVFALPLAWVLYRHEFFDPAFLADVEVAPAFYTVAALGVLAVTAGDVVRRFREAV
ncbi:HAAS signaling domain-containing protein [Planomonospora parontospora]|uniref:HAAS signaling domain-containing protein n=1 Tax=Planomonospora parontospora TaxID=58119 RepID=UPI001991A1C5|nr:hypothetical protein [Planomonospora parontospora]GGL11913.1 hypothetical protein GCM10014719_12320 [Planomonospora parontospora subsp. antibiotica]GII14103.1 hypothetical protein Ppa05_08290 [Planomonospora parontospora subsp. antibiotica]